MCVRALLRATTDSDLCLPLGDAIQERLKRLAFLNTLYILQSSIYYFLNFHTAVSPWLLSNGGKLFFFF